jgi:hypothetical protein
MHSVKHAIRSSAGAARRRWSFYKLRRGGYSAGRLLAGRCGFFGNMFMTLNGIRLCEAAGVRAEPFWGPDDSLFYDPARGENAWLYYFQDVPPPPGYKPPADATAARVMTFRPTAHTIHPRYAGMGIRASYAECIRRYVRLRDDVSAAIDEAARTTFGTGPVVGVHVRQTDTVSGFENRRSFDFDRYYKAADAYLAKEPSAKVFVASDSAPAVEEFRRRYPDRVVALDCIRSTDGRSIHGHYDGGVQGSPSQKGLDVVRDSYLLSRVSHLVRTDSSVTTYSLCLNPTLTFTDLSLDAGRGATHWLQDGT